MSDELKSAMEVWPLIKTAGLDIQCWPDEKTPSLMRLRITLGVNSDEKTQTIIDALIDPVPGNGVICQWNNLTWLIHQSEKLARLEQLAQAAKELAEVFAPPNWAGRGSDEARAFLEKYFPKGET